MLGRIGVLQTFLKKQGDVKRELRGAPFIPPPASCNVTFGGLPLPQAQSSIPPPPSKESFSAFTHIGLQVKSPGFFKGSAN